MTAACDKTLSQLFLCRSFQDQELRRWKTAPPKPEKIIIVMTPLHSHYRDHRAH
jgi:hypothetical protein